MTTTIAVLFSAMGSGMGDVGKFAVMHALKRKGVAVRPVALTWKEPYAESVGLDVDVTGKAIDGKEKVKTAFQELDYAKLDLAEDSAQGKLEEVLDGCSGVVACLGSRQPGKARWCAPGYTKMSAAMKTKGVNRLVLLSSMGIGDDYLPLSGIKLFWGFLLRVFFRSALHDLRAMETQVFEESSHLDWVVVRPMGLTPEEPPRGKSDILQARGEGSLEISVSKDDVAVFMVDECVSPSLHNKAVTIGHKITK